MKKSPNIYILYYLIRKLIETDFFSERAIILILYLK